MNNLYSVLILRHDQQHVIIVQTDNKDEARNAYTELVDKWSLALKESQPFLIDNGITASATDPKMISDIRLEATAINNRINPNNPFMQEMQSNGFSNTFSKYRGQQPPHAADPFDGSY